MAKENLKKTPRLMAVVGYLVFINPEDGELYYLLERRGKACDNAGKLVSICGYIERDETRLQALLRETKEETGLDISKCSIYEWKTTDDPNESEKQDIATNYVIIGGGLDETIKSYVENFNPESLVEFGGNPDEVENLVLIKLADLIETTSDEDFAFNHRNYIIDSSQLVIELFKQVSEEDNDDNIEEENNIEKEDKDE